MGCRVLGLGFRWGGAQSRRTRAWLGRRLSFSEGEAAGMCSYRRSGLFFMTVSAGFSEF